jgi:4-hydroxythreonine-4-phosphate dehydrogenase
MSKTIAIIAGEPNSISSEIIFKSWIERKNFTHKPFIVIGSVKLLNLQKKKLNFKINIKEVDNKLSLKNVKKNEMPVYNVDYNQKKPFEAITIKTNKYILNCFTVALEFLKNKKILGLINCPISKETLFKEKHQGITEFLSKKSGRKGQEVMLLFNKKLSVSPLTTHIPIKYVYKKILKIKIIDKVKIINKFYLKNFKKKPKIALLGLNPHNFYSKKEFKEKKAILSIIKKIKHLNINIIGPIPADTSFMLYKNKKIDVILGMYHDQVLTPFKTLFKYDAINITLGLPFIRLSPDHGVAKDIVGKKVADPSSLIQSIKFFNYIK